MPQLINYQGRLLAGRSGKAWGSKDMIHSTYRSVVWLALATALTLPASAGWTRTRDGALARSERQRLEGRVTEEGLWLVSIAGDHTRDKVCVRAESLGRESDRMDLPAHGRIEVEDGLARWVRPGLVEEYSVNLDGVRQDFLVADKPDGEGHLRVGLVVSGARVAPASSDAAIVLNASGRRLRYARLHVADAEGHVLRARMEITDGDRFDIVVADAEAVYPLRIDPTFSDADWDGMNAMLATNEFVFAFAVDEYSGQVYAGGSFTSIGGVPANRVARWDGNGWTNLGSGLNGDVNALALGASNQLFVGGGFTTAGGLPATNVARWNGVGWTNMSSGLNGPVLSLALGLTNQLYAGGSFTLEGVFTEDHVAIWNGSTWSRLGIGMNNTVHALAVDHAGNLYAGGFFTSAGSNSANRVAMWNGSSWTNLGSGMNDNVLALAVHKSGLVFAGGAFTKADGFSANRISSWNGVIWGPWLGANTNSLVTALKADPAGSLFVGGTFTNMDGVAANRIAVWNANGWSALGSGLNGPVFGLATDGPGNLYVGGSFTTAGGTSSAGIARADVRSISSWSLDEAGNYPGSPDFFTGANRGTGYEPWVLSLAPGAFAGLADSSPNTGDINSTNGKSFVFFGGPGGTYAEGTRRFYFPFSTGDVFAATIAYNFNGGNRGVAFLNDFDSELLFVNFGSGDQLSTAWTGGPPVTISSTYLSTAILHVAITQISSNQLAARLRRNDGYTTNLLSDAFPGPASLRKVKFYNGGHPADNSNYALFANDLIILRAGARPRFIDSDSDGMPDDWEHPNGLNPAVANAPASNADGDALTDFQEYVADTQPTNALSFFPSIVLTNASAAAMALVIDPTSTSRVYVVEATTNLLDSPQVWDLVSPEVAGLGGPVTISISNDVPARQYRTGVRRPND